MTQAGQGNAGDAAKTTPTATVRAALVAAADRLMMVCLGLGAWGVLSGYALFVLLREQLETHTPWATLAALVVAAGVAWLSEALRERIGPGETHTENDHKLQGDKAGPRLPVMILMLGMFELFVSAWHGVSELRSGELIDTGMVLLGDEMGTRLNATWALVGLALLWVLEGAVLAAVLGRTVFRQANTLPTTHTFREALRPTLRNSGVGALAGAVAGAVGILLTAILMRTIAAVSFMASQPQEWLALVRRASSWGGIAWIIFKPLEWLSRLWMWGTWGWVLTLVALWLVWGYCRSEKKYWPLGLLLAGMAILIISPLLDNFGTLAMLVFLASLVWAVPGALLGASVPLLRGPAAKPQFWSVAGFLAAAILGGVALLRGADQFLSLEIIAGILALVAGIIFWRGGSLAANWPLAALVLALFVGMATRVQQATFQGVLDKLSILVEQPQQKGSAPREISPLERLDRLKNFHTDTSWGLGDQHSLAPAPTPLRDFALAPLTAPATQPATITPPAPTALPALPHLYDFSKQLRGISRTLEDPSITAARSLQLQTAAAQNTQKRTEAFLGDERQVKIYLKDLESSLQAVRDRRQALEEALSTYRKHPLQDPGLDPAQWPDRQGGVALLSLNTLERRLTQQIEHVQSLLAEHRTGLSAGQIFELTVTASLAFWVTVGLLLGWSQRERMEKQDQTSAT